MLRSCCTLKLDKTDIRLYFNLNKSKGMRQLYDINRNENLKLIMFMNAHTSYSLLVNRAILLSIPNPFSFLSR